VERTLDRESVLGKAALVLDALDPEPLTLAELVEATGLPRATAHRTAVALERVGLVRRDDEGRFALGLRLVGLGRAAAAAVPLASLARPVLEELRDRTGESVQLFVADGDARLCLVSLESSHGLRWIVPDGARLPLDRGSAGRVLSGSLGRDGWVASVEEREPGVASVSAPVHDGAGAVVGAVSLSGPVERLTRHPGARFGAAVVAAAADLETRLTR
jgi:DNA-binding IclR family transcriptional regulator